jgi:hypothetical protein
MNVYRWRGKRWIKQTVEENETYETLLLPDFQLPLGALLSISDKYHDS